MFKFPTQLYIIEILLSFRKYFYLCINKIQNDNKFLNKAITMFFEKIFMNLI